MATRRGTKRRVLDARPDTIDFRDRMFVPTLAEVPEKIPLAAFKKRCGGRPLVLDQGTEGACTGFGLAAVCNFLLRTREVYPSRAASSARMLYAMARRYDEWRGEDYDGSSARGAMKGWHKHGVCSRSLWSDTDDGERLDDARAQDAAKRPLGAYFRVNHRDLVAMHAALAEVGILFASATTHSGWDRVDARTGRIPPGKRLLGGHAFAIVGYDADGFWIQNSWGAGWGKGGFGHLAYADWLDHGYDVWVARLGAPVRIAGGGNVGTKLGGLATSKLSFPEIRPHVVSLGNDGRLRRSGTYGNDEEDVRRLFERDLPRVTAGWKRKRVLLYAHGGLVPEDNALQRIENYLPAMLENEIYPLAFVWKTDFWTTIGNILHDALRRRRTEGVLDAAKDFMLDRLDDTLERIARVVRGKAVWDEMKENALLASASAEGGARIVASCLERLAASDPKVGIHLAAHSAGSILLAPFAKGLAASGLSVETCTLWAPACSVALFKDAYLGPIEEGRIARYAQFNLTDAAERDDHCARVYHKSLLYLVSNALEEKARPVFRQDGTPILGLDKFVAADRDLARLFRGRRAEYVTAPNDAEEGSASASRARHHGDFDDDAATLRATLARVLGRGATRTEFSFERSAASTRDRRQALS